MCSFYSASTIARMKQSIARMTVDYQNKGQYLGMDGRIYKDSGHIADCIKELDDIGCWR